MIPTEKNFEEKILKKKKYKNSLTLKIIFNTKLNSYMTKFVKFYSMIPLLFTVLFLSTSCSPKISIEGNLIEKEVFDKLTIGIDTKEDVMKKMGSPFSSIGSNHVWYYISYMTEKSFTGQIKFITSNIFIIKFDDENVLESKRYYDAPVKNVTIERERTISEAKSSYDNYVKYLLRNISTIDNSSTK